MGGVDGAPHAAVFLQIFVVQLAIDGLCAVGEGEGEGVAVGAEGVRVDGHRQLRADAAQIGENGAHLALGVVAVDLLPSVLVCPDLQGGDDPAAVVFPRWGGIAAAAEKKAQHKNKNTAHVNTSFALACADVLWFIAG